MKVYLVIKTKYNEFSQFSLHTHKNPIIETSGLIEGLRSVHEIEIDDITSFVYLKCKYCNSMGTNERLFESAYMNLETAFNESKIKIGKFYHYVLIRMKVGDASEGNIREACEMSNAIINCNTVDDLEWHEIVFTL